MSNINYHTEEYNCHQMEGFIELCLPYKCEDTDSELVNDTYVIYVEEMCIALIENYKVVFFDEDYISERTTEIQNIIRREYLV